MKTRTLRGTVAVAGIGETTYYKHGKSPDPEFKLALMWANDYPHHEGTWPHSAQAIERTMGQVAESAGARILGVNAARFFGFPVPPGYTA